MLEAERRFNVECRRLYYLSVPPNAALSAVRLLGEAGLVDRARILMEKPFGTHLTSAVSLNSKLHEVFAEEQIFRIDPVQIDVPEILGFCKRSGFYEQTGACRDRVVTHLFQILGFTAMEALTSLEPKPISEEKNKVFRSMLPSDIVPSVGPDESARERENWGSGKVITMRII